MARNTAPGRARTAAAPKSQPVRSAATKRSGNGASANAPRATAPGRFRGQAPVAAAPRAAPRPTAPGRNRNAPMGGGRGAPLSVAAALLRRRSAGVAPASGSNTPPR
jgi:hypothetical protein